jgi:hypothetical protein
MAPKVKQADSSEIAEKVIDVTRLATYDEVARELVESGANLVNAGDLADGFSILKNKDQLVGSEFIIISWDFRMSPQFGTEFAIIRLVTKATNSKVIITDGGAGIYGELVKLPDHINAVYCPTGLRRSDYEASPDYDPETGAGRPAGTTYWLDTSGGKLPAGTL